MSKTKKTTNKKRLDQKNDSALVEIAKWVEDYLHVDTLKMAPMTDMGLERFAQDIVVWAKTNDDALRAYDFALMRGITKDTYYGWIDKYPVIGNAHRIVQQLIASRREIGALTRKYSETAVFRSLHQFDPDAERAAKFHASLKAEADESANQRRYIIVEEKIVIPNFGSSDLVPTKE